jgi:hypothetical protein
MTALLELNDFYRATSVKLELQSRVETMFSTEYQKGLQVVERPFQKAIDSDTDMLRCQYTLYYHGV